MVGRGWVRSVPMERVSNHYGEREEDEKRT